MRGRGANIIVIQNVNSTTSNTLSGTKLFHIKSIWVCVCVCIIWMFIRYHICYVRKNFNPISILTEWIAYLYGSLSVFILQLFGSLLNEVLLTFGLYNIYSVLCDYFICLSTFDHMNMILLHIIFYIYKLCVKQMRGRCDWKSGMWWLIYLLLIKLHYIYWIYAYA